MNNNKFISVAKRYRQTLVFNENINLNDSEATKRPGGRVKQPPKHDLQLYGQYIWLTTHENNGMQKSSL